MSGKKRLLVIGAALLPILTGCRAKVLGSTSTSHIVQEVETAGSGSLEGLDELTIQRWLNGHPDVATRIAPECKAVGSGAPAEWANSIEGILCTADAQVMLTISTDVFKPY